MKIFIFQLSELVQENASLKGKLLTMKEYVNNAEVETKASRETIMRLVSEAEKEQRNNSRYNVEMDNLRVVCIHFVIALLLANTGRKHSIYKCAW